MGAHAGMAVLLGLEVVALAILGAGQSAAEEPSPTFEAREWSASWAPFSDDFEDGILPDGDGEEIALYRSDCGPVTDADEGEGRLRLQGPGEFCGGPENPDLQGSRVTLNALLGGAFRLRARFDPQELPLPPPLEPSGPLVGIGVATPDAGEALNLFFLRQRQPSGGDVLFLGLVDELGTEVGAAPLSGTPQQFVEAARAIEVELALAPIAEGTMLAPTARFRICDLGSPGSCNDWSSLTPGPSAGTLPADVPLAADLFALTFSEQSFAIDVLDWEATGELGGPLRSGDDFEDGELGRTLAYSPDCLVTEETGGALRGTADPEGTGCDGGLTALVTLPGPERVGARFAFETFPRCGGGPGVGFVGLPDDGLDGSDLSDFVPDSAFLRLVRGPMPGVGHDVLAVLLLAEAEEDLPSSLGNPIERLILSEGPDSDPGLAGVETIEMDVQLRPESGALRPHGRVRLCESADCVDDPPYHDLEPWKVPQEEPGFLLCGATAASLAPPLDDGLISARRSSAPALLFVPEPRSGTLGAAALASLGLLMRCRSRRPAAGKAPIRQGSLTRRERRR